ncbi:MAG: antitoxin, RHH family protein [Elusimicrobia bacterium]|nr:antitoxin, RHH family protein [Elusimicrobiota bacterium]
MATKNPRLLVTLEPALYAKVRSVSKTNGTTLSMAARDLIREACEDIEDLGLSLLADKRMKSVKGRRWLKHSDVWK